MRARCCEYECLCVCVCARADAGLVRYAPANTTETMYVARFCVFCSFDAEEFVVRLGANRNYVLSVWIRKS